MKNMKNKSINILKSVIFYAGFFSMLLGVVAEGPVMPKALFATVGTFCMIGVICSGKDSSDISKILGGEFFNTLFGTNDFTEE